MAYLAGAALTTRIFEVLDYGRLGEIYCDEGGDAFWQEHAEPARLLGVQWARSLATRVDRGGSSVYVGAGVYSEQVTPSNDGTASDPIRFIADTDGSKTSDPGTVEITRSSGYVVNVDRDNYIEFVWLLPSVPRSIAGEVPWRW